MAGTWKHVSAGHYQRIASDGVTILADVIKGITGGTYYRECWNAYVYPKGKQNWTVTREGYRTAKEAKVIAECAYKAAVRDLDSGFAPQ